MVMRVDFYPFSHRTLYLFMFKNLNQGARAQWQMSKLLTTLSINDGQYRG